MFFKIYDIYNGCMHFLQNILSFLDHLKFLLGSTGFCDVFKLGNTTTKAYMVLKAIRFGFEGDDHYWRILSAIESEIQVGIKLGSSFKFLVQLSEYFKPNGCFCLIMEYCSGCYLQKIFDENNTIPQPV
jgi:serine/threonine protein kinase